MKYLITIVSCIVLIYSISSCRSTKKLQTAVSRKDTQLVIAPAPVKTDSLKGAADIL